MKTELLNPIEILEKRFDKTRKAFIRISGMLHCPGGSDWRQRFNLNELPKQSRQEKIIYLKSAARIASSLPSLEGKTLPRLKETLSEIEEQLELEKSIAVIRQSVERKKQGLPGLTEVVLFEAEEFFKELKDKELKRRSTKLPKRTQLVRTDEKESDACALDLTGREKEVFDYLLTHQDGSSKLEVASAIWKEEEGFKPEQAVSNASHALSRLNVKGFIVNSALRGKGIKGRYKVNPDQFPPSTNTPPIDKDEKPPSENHTSNDDQELSQPIFEEREKK